MSSIFASTHDSKVIRGWSTRASFSQAHKDALEIVEKYMTQDGDLPVGMKVNDIVTTLVSLVEEYETVMLGDGGAPQKVSGGWLFNGQITQMVEHKDDLYILTSKGEMYKLSELE